MQRCNGFKLVLFQQSFIQLSTSFFVGLNEVYYAALSDTCRYLWMMTSQHVSNPLDLTG